MERREQYDPEDIENLLSERSFEELLEEERAYVLRHLAGREEYETMRALLYQVRNDERSEGRITAPPEVRSHVMDVFRQQQRPQWRVWLNSVGTLLWPKEASAMWRPALALGTVALLITAGIFVFRQADEGHTQLAELKLVKAAEAEKELGAGAPALDSVRGASRSGAIEFQDGTPVREPERNSTDAAGYVTAAPVDDKVTRETLDETVTGTTVQTFDIAAAATEEVPATEGENHDVDDVRQQRAGVPASTSHQVTDAELARNESLANVTIRSRSITKQKFEFKKEASAASRSLVEDAALVSLLNSGW